MPIRRSLSKRKPEGGLIATGKKAKFKDRHAEGLLGTGWKKFPFMARGTWGDFEAPYGCRAVPYQAKYGTVSVFNWQRFSNIVKKHEGPTKPVKPDVTRRQSASSRLMETRNKGLGFESEQKPVGVNGPRSQGGALAQRRVECRSLRVRGCTVNEEKVSGLSEVGRVGVPRQPRKKLACYDHVGSQLFLKPARFGEVGSKNACTRRSWRGTIGANHGYAIGLDSL
ncbi:hypothetical protein GOBAR_AA15181 [Gossypium barbadense]|uniref:Uncharacterized protein n=1 Tax=Gossypium barbadense TaxID=3634 RepID=A0A2P5XQ58_GOSBA|nr:hypothetical protein GOBAR_AA15181 [Gossypium barbadense]